MTFPEPTDPMTSRSEVFLAYLDHFRNVLLTTLAPLSEADLRESRLPSGWAPIELLKHLTHVERRWLEWGFEGADLADPWADQRDGRWYVHPDETLAVLQDALARQAVITAAIVTSHELTDIGAPGPRWEGAPPASLERVLMHLLQEYARHVGHLDITRELIDGAIGPPLS